MSNDKKEGSKVDVSESANIPTMQKATTKKVFQTKSANIPKIDAVPTGGSTTSTSTGSKGGTKSD